MDPFERIAAYYDYDYRDYDDDIDLVVALGEECAGALLELGCGTGRLLLPLADAGLDVTGVDASPGLLAKARAKLGQGTFSGHTTLVQADLRSFSLPRRDFAFACCMSNTFMHLNTVADQMAMLAASHRHLRGDGLLLIDLFNPDIPRLLQVDGVMELADQWQQDDAHVVKWSVRSLDLAEQLQETLFIYEEFAPNGESRRTHFPFTLRFLWRNEAELMLEKAGFSVEAVWGSFDGDPYDSQSDRLILLARKQS